jgi:hypothetical protein
MAVGSVARRVCSLGVEGVWLAGMSEQAVKSKSRHTPPQGDQNKHKSDTQSNGKPGSIALHRIDPFPFSALERSFFIW